MQESAYDPPTPCSQCGFACSYRPAGGIFPTHCRISHTHYPLFLNFMEGFGVHTFRLVNAEGKSTFVKFHWKPKLGLQSNALIFELSKVETPRIRARMVSHLLNIDTDLAKEVADGL